MGFEKLDLGRSRPETVSIMGGRASGLRCPSTAITNGSLPLRRSGMCSLGRAGSSTPPELLHEPAATVSQKPLSEP
jgi:hypothetical protein